MSFRSYKVYPTFYGEIRVIILIKKIYSRNMAGVKDS